MRNPYETERGGNKEVEPTFEVVYQEWEESERHMEIRPDGYSIHLSLADRDEYIRAYRASMPRGEAPEAYSRPVGGARPYFVTQKTYDRLAAAKEDSRFGLRFYQ